MPEKQNYDDMTIEVDTDLLEEVRSLLAPYGLTPERLAEQFFTWMVEYPEAAIPYLLETQEKYGTTGQNL